MWALTSAITTDPTLPRSPFQVAVPFYKPRPGSNRPGEPDRLSVCRPEGFQTVAPPVWRGAGSPGKTGQKKCPSSQAGSQAPSKPFCYAY